MMQYMENKFGIQATNGKPGELKALQSQAAELQAKMDAKKSSDDSDASERSIGSHEDTDPDEEDDYMEDLPDVKAMKARGPRVSVSAEAFGAWN